ncbi:hypothetical protein ACQP2P_15415 [Dactylosporangium sp. CA-139114]|uniref:hypothetical protein n=1 Tax=Dactylosporangium sp. CA-139114 TaxID=3239931 RepID=UPI003D957877
MLIKSSSESAASIEISSMIMGVRERGATIERLRSELAATNVSVSYEHAPNPDPTVLQSAAIAWSNVPETATHHVVVQDDVELGDNFVGALQAAARIHPNCAISFFAEWGCKTASLVRVAALIGAGWVEGIDKYVQTQALLMPASSARALGGYLKDRRDSLLPEDVLVLEFLRREGLRHLVAAPNLAQHLDLPSMTGNAWQGPRRSVHFDRSGGLPAERTVEGVAAVPFYQWRVGKTWLLTRETSGAGDWRREPLAAVLERQGWASSDTTDMLAGHRFLAPDPAPDMVRYLSGVVEMSAATTMTAAAIAPADRLSMAAGSPAAAAFATLGDGALRSLLPPATLDAIRDRLRAMVGAVVTSAAARLASGALRPLGA